MDNSKKIGKVVDLIDHASELLDGVIYDTEQGGQHFSDGAEKLMIHLLRPLYKLRIELRSNNYSDVIADEDDPFELSPQLTKLLILAASGPRADDGLPVFREKAEIRKELKVTARALNTLVYRLRQTFLENRLNRELVQTNGSQIRVLTRNLQIKEDVAKAIP